MKIISFLFIVLFFATSCVKNELIQSDFNEVIEILSIQEDTWNDGNIAGFMESYWKSDSLRFISSGDLKLGWENTIKRYYENYPDKEAMGKLKFEVIDIYPISSDAVGLSGSYHLTRTIGNLNGYFALVFKRMGGEWKIISDITCAN